MFFPGQGDIRLPCAGHFEKNLRHEVAGALWAQVNLVGFLQRNVFSTVELNMCPKLGREPDPSMRQPVKPP